jgi:hypothetical protein
VRRQHGGLERHADIVHGARSGIPLTLGSEAVSGFHK